MRSFPGAGPRRAVGLPALAALACLGLVASAVSPAVGDDGHHLKRQQQAVHSQVQQAQADADDASAEVSSATQAVERSVAQLKSAYATLADARDHVASVATQLSAAQAADVQAQAALATAQTARDQAQATLTAAQSAVTTGRQRLADQRTQVQQTVVGLYQTGSPDLIALSGYLDSSSPSDLTRKLEYSQTLVEDQTSAFDGLHDAEVALVAQQAAATQAEHQAADAEQQLAAQQQQTADALAQTQALDAQAVAARTAAQQAKATVAATLEDRRQAKVHAQHARKRDLAKLAELKKQEQHIKDLILAAAARDHGKGFVGDSSGFLLPPIPGAELTSPFGYRIHPIYHYWGLHDGDDFAAPCGSRMQASADGTVIAAYWSDVYGNRLYVDVGKVNGHDITINYNHAERYTVGVGDQVTRGQTVGFEGTTGWSTGCHTHFTVLQDGDPVDPMLYLNGNG